MARAHRGFLVLEADALSEGAWTASVEAMLRGSSRALDSDGKPTGKERKARFSVILVGTDTALWRLRDTHPRAELLFRRRVPSSNDLPRDCQGVGLVASLLQDHIEREGLGPVSTAAIRWLVEEGAGGRIRRKRISLDLDRFYQALSEARGETSASLTRPRVEARLQALRDRNADAEDYARFRVDEDLLAVETEGNAVGLVNGLMVYGSSRQPYAMPGRISARISVGREGLINIEREAKYSGRSFDKGMFQLSAYLRGLFGSESPLGVAATLVFEQSNGKVDGDSATLAESVALLSALAELPCRQGVAISGSINQRGEVLPVGSVNLKVEGWWKTCKQRGLTGTQGVVLPRRNRPDLQLPEEIVTAVSEGRFHIWAVSHIHEALPVVLGQPAGKAKKDGGFTANSVLDRAERRVNRLSERLYPKRKAQVSKAAKTKAAARPKRAARRKPAAAQSKPKA
ncbi:MAG: S16 family serine protease [Myxococcota bacterium]|nr:S16 family serine protease [Myxococcota bacterium]